MYSTRASIRLAARRRTPSLPGCRVRQASKYAPSEGEVQAATKYCNELLQKYDSPSYTLQTFIPPSARSAYLCIRAFNVSLSSVADSVSSPTVGALRMQFWRDTISRTFDGRPPKEPVAMLLSHALAELARRGARGLNRSWFMRVIGAREQYLTNAPYVDVAGLEAYAESTYSSLLYLTLSALPLHSLAADHLASHIGKASGIAAVLRGIPLLAFPPPPNHHSNPAGLAGSLGGTNRQGAVTLPLDVMASTGVREEDVQRHGAEAQGLRDAVFTVATRANDHLITAREMLKNLGAGDEVGHDFEHQDDGGHDYGGGVNGAQAQLAEVERGLGVLMPAVATSLWLQRLERLDFDLFRPELRRREWRLPWKAYVAYNRRSF